MKSLKFLILPLCIAYAVQAKHVAISVVAQHPSLDRIRMGIEDRIRQYDPSIKITVDNANGNPATATQIANKFISKSPDVLVGVATLSAQTLHSANKGKIPLVFSGVTDPYAAQLIPKSGQRQLPITGTIDFPPTDEQIAYITTQFPDVKTIGIIYNSGEVNSVNQVKAFENKAKANGYEVIKVSAIKVCDVLESTSKIAPYVDLIYVPNDNTVVSAIEAVVKASSEYDTPVLTSDPESLSRGATATVAHNQYDVGTKTGELVVRILKGEKAQEMALVTEYDVIKKHNNQNIHR